MACLSLHERTISIWCESLVSDMFLCPSETRASVCIWCLELYCTESVHGREEGSTGKCQHEVEGTPETECWYFPVLPDSSQCTDIIQFSKHRPSGPMLSISRFVRLFDCVSVCLSVCSLLRYRLTVFLPPLPEVGCPIFLEIRNPWGKVITVLSTKGLRRLVDCCTILCGKHGPGQ